MPNVTRIIWRGDFASYLRWRDIRFCLCYIRQADSFVFKVSLGCGTGGLYAEAHHWLSGGGMRILVVGATGLLGKEIVGLLSVEHEVIGASRKGSAVSVDISDKQSIVAMYKQVGTVHAVVCVAGTAKFARLDTLTDDDFAFSLANKLMGQANLVRYGVPYIIQGGSVTLTSGLLAQHPMPGSAAVSTVNAAIE